MPSEWSRRENEPAFDWLKRLRGTNVSALDESYRRALAHFIETARKTWHKELGTPEPEESAILSDAKDAYLRLEPAERAQFVAWLKEIGEADPKP